MIRSGFHQFLGPNRLFGLGFNNIQKTGTCQNNSIRFRSCLSGFKTEREREPERTQHPIGINNQHQYRAPSHTRSEFGDFKQNENWGGYGYRVCYGYTWTSFKFVININIIPYYINQMDGTAVSWGGINVGVLSLSLSSTACNFYLNVDIRSGP